MTRPRIDEQDGVIVGPGNELTLTLGPQPFVRLADDVAVAPEAIVALVQRTYRHDGTEHHCVDVHVAHVRAPILIDGATLADVLAKLDGHG